MCRCTLWIWRSRDTVSIATELAVHACRERRRPAVRQQRHCGTPGAEPVPETLREAEPPGTAGTCSPLSPPGMWLQARRFHAGAVTPPGVPQEQPPSPRTAPSPVPALAVGWRALMLHKQKALPYGRVCWNSSLLF